MNRKLLLLMTLVLLCLSCGCSKGKAILSQNVEENEKGNLQTELKHLDCRTILPDVKVAFSNDSITTIYSEMEKCSYYITGCKVSDYDNYIDNCKKNGFTNIQYEGENDGGKMYYANDTEYKYYIQVMIGLPDGNVSISCTMEDKSKSEPSSDSNLLNIVPDPYDNFKEAKITNMGSDENKCSYFVENYGEGTFDLYVQKCKEAGFTNINNEWQGTGGKTFSAYNADNTLFLQISLSTSTNMISIQCSKE